jgi:hypothetical protein
VGRRFDKATAETKMARSSSRHFYARIPSNSGFFYSFNV